MQSAPMRDAPGDNREHFPVSVLLERRLATATRWSSYVWTATGIVVGSREDERHDEPVLLSESEEVSRYLVSGLQVALYIDECESYYHNLVTGSPRAYVIANLDETSDERRPDPFLVSMSFDEAHAYLEGDEEVYAVDIPPELYRWTEAFVLAHYIPEKKYKRKLKNWKKSEDEKGRA